MQVLFLIIIYLISCLFPCQTVQTTPKSKSLHVKQEKPLKKTQQKCKKDQFSSQLSRRQAPHDLIVLKTAFDLNNTKSHSANRDRLKTKQKEALLVIKIILSKVCR